MKTYAQTLEMIHRLGMFSHPASLSRITELMRRLGNPQTSFPAVHIAGTNGKGSTATMTAAVFRAAGLKTGLFISPYVIDFCERIQVNGRFIPRETLVELSGQVSAAGVAVTEFEFITAVGLLYFAQQKCDIAVIETGLGGRLDATNVLQNVRVSAITKIGLDHTAILGDTLEQIAAEKCGIIKNGAAVVSSGNQPEAAMRVIRAAAAERLTVPDRAALEVLHTGLDGCCFRYKDAEYRTVLAGAHQVENALTAIEIVNHSGFAIAAETIAAGLAAAYFPARLEVLRREPLLVLDGAHNPDGAAVLADAMRPYAGQLTAVVGMMRDKNCEDFLAAVLPLCRRTVTVRAADMPRAMEPQALAALAARHCREVTAADSYTQALSAAFDAADGGPVLICGSLYLASSIRPLLTDYAHR